MAIKVLLSISTPCILKRVSNRVRSHLIRLWSNNGIISLQRFRIGLLWLSSKLTYNNNIIITPHPFHRCFIIYYHFHFVLQESNTKSCRAIPITITTSPSFPPKAVSIKWNTPSRPPPPPASRALRYAARIHAW